MYILNTPLSRGDYTYFINFINNSRPNTGTITKGSSKETSAFKLIENDWIYTIKKREDVYANSTYILHFFLLYLEVSLLHCCCSFVLSFLPCLCYAKFLLFSYCLSFLEHFGCYIVFWRIPLLFKDHFQWLLCFDPLVIFIILLFTMVIWLCTMIV